ncbi:TetR/AcrR family transcriptional regulator [Corynebacterium lubricantis]|uniref:TetR/AcrR family transcriptional regulator n=1 Tax=Corynebacterium lubricantis TaxID=541095 RepID=UPI00036B092A|nr:TetR/AcrR family transcriptional regulator [Corynebacterium lubricantis]
MTDSRNAQEQEPFEADLPEASSGVPVEHVISIALEYFSEQGFADTKLDAIAKDSGMSKRMIHYHFGDKKGLYQQALVSAISTMQPPAELLDRSYAVPVEGVRRFVDALYYRMAERPEALRLIMRESLNPVLEVKEMSAISDSSDLTLHLERLLMMGQDVGAFRPDISADDILVLIISLTSYRVTSRNLTLNLFDIDLLSRENTEGMRRFIIDAVLAFLTSNIPDSGHSSYLTQKSPVPNDEGNGELYGIDSEIY